MYKCVIIISRIMFLQDLTHIQYNSPLILYCQPAASIVDEMTWGGDRLKINQYRP